MSKQITSTTSQDITKGLEIVELEQRLEMVHLTAVEAEASSRCDVGGDVEVPEISVRMA
ncbi:hypothetical protein QWY85_09045 [Neolewinella lacunae]|uniref:Uncharacterized protein n=1 Tax=Neolewinella lacunae TaxID=1517758 RepID=A0A923PSF2_9BACT|nr:hypothetical protein [Neolewinella lacunae]MBC6996633.1 hypothetical protein [Neolewinella lacunae]MDN3634803.1 hypothetical protein [Neolewinella lacunae]